MGAHWRNLANTTEPYVCGRRRFGLMYKNYFDQLFICAVEYEHNLINIILSAAHRNVSREFIVSKFWT